MSLSRAWRDGAKKREKKKQQQAGKPHIVDLQFLDAPVHWFVPDNVEEDPAYEDSDIELLQPRPIRRPQRRRQRGSG